MEVWVYVVAIFSFIGLALFFLSPQEILLGNVISEDCGCVAAEPVCVQSGNRLVTLPSSCHASCADLIVVFDGPCVAVAGGSSAK